MKNFLKALPFIFVLTSFLLTFLLDFIFELKGIHLINMRYGFGITFAAMMYLQTGIMYLFVGKKFKKRKNGNRQ